MAGFEFDLTERLNINTEGYVKQFTQLTNFNRNKLFPDNVTYAGEPDAFKKDFIVETGRAVGADVVVKYEERETYLWFVYGLGTSTVGMDSNGTILCLTDGTTSTWWRARASAKEVVGVGALEFGLRPSIHPKSRLLPGSWDRRWH